MVWEGYQLETGVFGKHEYGLVLPKESAPGNPYLWRTEFFGAFPSVDLSMLEQGYAVAYYRISDLYGGPEAVGLMERFQPFLQERYGLSAQAILLGFSRGGLYALHYAARYPERIAALYLDAPVVDIYSWPGGFFSGEGSPSEWEDCKALWSGISHEAYLKKVNQAAEKLSAWSIPLIIVAGAKDTVVPYNENGLLLQRVYEKAPALFQLIMKPECGHHPHSLENPSPVVSFLLRSRTYPTCGNGLRINDQAKSSRPMTLIVHDMEHLDLVLKAQDIYAGRYPLGYIGTSPWPGAVTNQKTMDYRAAQSHALYDFLRAQTEIRWIVYGLSVEHDEADGISSLVRDMKEKHPLARQFWFSHGKRALGDSLESTLTECGIQRMEYGTEAELDAFLRELAAEAENAPVPSWHDPLDREDAEWTNLSITFPIEAADHRILLVGDSISVGYGNLVQALMPGWHVDRLNTSEGIHHPNFLRLLEIALEQYPYRLIHINNGIHLHGQTVEQYAQNLSKVFVWIHMTAPKAKIIFATTTPLSRRLEEDELTGFDARHFTMGDRIPLDRDALKAGYWITDEKASEIYRKLNEAAAAICKDYGIPVNDLYRLCVSENLQKSDGVHFQEDGYRRLAAQVAEALKRELQP